MIDGKRLPKATISLGITARRSGSTLDVMISEADVAMYHAKHSGKNRVVVASDVPDNVFENK